MKRAKIIILISVATVMGMVTFLFAVNNSYAETSKTNLSNEVGQKKYSGSKKQPEKVKKYPMAEKKSENKVAPINTPIYKPPMRGAPVGRVAGGTRGLIGENDILLCVLTPDHTALTTREQPSLYYYLGKKSQYPIELTVIEDQGIRPILEKQISPTDAPGIQAIHLRDYNLHLDKDKVYKWFVTIIPDPVRRSKDILAWGAVKRIDIPQSVRQKVIKLENAAASQIYAEAGIWYDSFAEISGLIESHPSNREFRQQRAALLEQVGLEQIAQYDMK